MLNISEEDLKKAIVEKAADELLRQDDDLSGMVRAEVSRRLQKIFVDRVDAQIAAAVDEAVNKGFDTEYQRVNQWGQPEGEKTTVRAQLDKLISGYWTTKVDARNGKPSDGYGSTTRAEYLMTQICAENFSEEMKKHALNIAGHLKDGLRGQMANVMDGMLNELFRVKSLQDQGKVEKPY
ncbi:hypothetical protein [Comamonas aquatica]|uniref:hypothetical protein n=1 Tax=Comamonas aquatica TaxID=225991 RepID=UPI00244D52D8|nr:hypothetical protein [Comamonas aquatica]MDH1673963.1 hypothetical protein [Comamonas aquatica]MDH1677175.1 hypothetical protein [Comamonas aquatica]